MHVLDNFHLGMQIEKKGEREQKYSSIDKDGEE